MNKFTLGFGMIWGLAVSTGYLAAQGPAAIPGGACHQPECPCPEVKVLASKLVETRVPTCEYETRRLWKPEIKEVQGCKWVDTDVCREIEEDVTCTKMMPVTVTDPSTGCTRTDYQPQTFVEKRKHLIIQIIPVKKEYHYRVLTFRSEEIDVPKTVRVFECQPPAPVTTKLPCHQAPCDQPVGK
jgi:hypothetical protein